ncbi:MAG: prepilin-type N-terminal cleavage/methylation domain-containing protein [Myxococcales bacterium]|nr:prepilin-type N-terminal cleavage/methylation domain-containing protein [Myxococcales bacterium]
MREPTLLRRAAVDPKKGFTLMELMITVAIVGVLSTVGFASFERFVTKSKASEGILGLGVLHKAATAYYYADHTTQGLGATNASRCLASYPISDGVDSGKTGGIGNNTIAGNKGKVIGDANSPLMDAIGFDTSGYVYYWYYVNTYVGPTAWGTCGVTGPVPLAYIYGANADLDGDGRPSAIYMAAGIDGNNELHRRGGIMQIPTGTVLYGATWEEEF